MKATAMFSARVPFAGFYESIWSSEIDHTQEMMLEQDHLIENYPKLAIIPQDQIYWGRINNSLWFHCADYGVIHHAIAKGYVTCFTTWLWDSLDMGQDKVEYEYEEMTSPKFYNFETDRLFAKLPRRVFIAIRRQLGREKVAQAFHRMFTSRSGFISHYSNETPRKAMREWDHNELYCLLSAWVEEKSEGIAFELLFEDMYDTVYDAVSEGTDWPKFEEEIEEVVADWMAEVRGGDRGGCRRLDRGTGGLRSDIRAAGATVPVHQGSAVRQDLTMTLTIDQALVVLTEAKAKMGGDHCLILSLSGSGIEDADINSMHVVYCEAGQYVEVRCTHPSLPQL